LTGGGGSGNSSGGSGSTSGGSSLLTTAPPVNGSNQQAVRVAYGIGNTPNQLLTSITVCASGSTTRCQTIDNILVDTGSSGLRLIESVLDPALGLSGITDTAGRQVGECILFADGTGIWGPTRRADVYIANQRASNIPVHVVGTAVLPKIPAGCPGSFKHTPESFGANGLLGIGPRLTDCGIACELNTFNGQYFACEPGGECSGTTVSANNLVINPVGAMPSHDNGTRITLASVPLAGAVSATGTLTLGIGTTGNNSLGSADVFPISPEPLTGILAFTTRFKSVDYAGFIDSGSNGLFIPDGELPLCLGSSDFFCPPSTQSLSAINFGNSGATLVNFSVFPADSYSAQFAALPGLTGPDVLGAFDFGLPFFFGRSIYTAIEDKATPGGTGPYFAY
jgi:hypothetical protein